MDLKTIRKLQSESSNHPSEELLLTMYIPMTETGISPSKTFRQMLTEAQKSFRSARKGELQLSEPNWDHWKCSGAMTLGLFRSENLTLLVPLRVRMPARSVVAKSFHLKPLIMAQKSMTNALLWRMTGKTATLYLIEPHSELRLTAFRLTGKNHDDSVRRMKEETLRELSPNTVGVAAEGESSLSFSFREIWGTQSPGQVLGVNDDFDWPEYLKEETRRKFENTIRDTLEEGKDYRNLRFLDVTRKLMNQELSRLCVSLEDMVYGNINPDTGAVEIHRHGGEVEDDVLDDLVEIALAQGVEVEVVPKRFFPNGASFLS